MRKRQHKKNIKNKTGLVLLRGGRKVTLTICRDQRAPSKNKNVYKLDNTNGNNTAVIELTWGCSHSFSIYSRRGGSL